MKKIFIIILLLFVSALMLSGCSNEKALGKCLAYCANEQSDEWNECGESFRYGTKEWSQCEELTRNNQRICTDECY